MPECTLCAPAQTIRDALAIRANLYGKLPETVIDAVIANHSGPIVLRLCGLYAYLDLRAGTAGCMMTRMADLAARIAMSRRSLLDHLKLLEDLDLVVREQNGHRVVIHTLRCGGRDQLDEGMVGRLPGALILATPEVEAWAIYAYVDLRSDADRPYYASFTDIGDDLGIHRKTVSQRVATLAALDAPDSTPYLDVWGTREHQAIHARFASAWAGSTNDADTPVAPTLGTASEQADVATLLSMLDTHGIAARGATDGDALNLVRGGHADLVADAISHSASYAADGWGYVKTVVDDWIATPDKRKRRRNVPPVAPAAEIRRTGTGAAPAAPAGAERNRSGAMAPDAELRRTNTGETPEVPAGPEQTVTGTMAPDSPRIEDPDPEPIPTHTPPAPSSSTPPDVDSHPLSAMLGVLRAFGIPATPTQREQMERWLASGASPFLTPIEQHLAAIPTPSFADVEYLMLSTAPEEHGQRVATDKQRRRHHGLFERVVRRE